MRQSHPVSPAKRAAIGLAWAKNTRGKKKLLQSVRILGKLTTVQVDEFRRSGDVEPALRGGFRMSGGQFSFM
jgi:hypothetical protein